MSKMITPEIARDACMIIDFMIDQLSAEAAAARLNVGTVGREAIGARIRITANTLIAGVLAEARMRYNREIDDSE
jgi:hypothetical protein